MSATINSQEKEIEFLKKNAVAQEIRIKDLETLVNKMLMNTNYDPNACGHCLRPPGIEIIAYPGVGNLNIVMNKNMNDIIAYRIRLFEKEAIQLKEAQEAYEENERKSIADAAEKKKQEDEKAMKEREMKTIKDMMARVALLEETAKKEELELENLKLISEPKMEEIEITCASEMQRLMVREVNGAGRAAEMRAEQAKLRGTQKNCSKSSCDPSMWSNKKAERISRMWCE